MKNRQASRHILAFCAQQASPPALQAVGFRLQFSFRAAVLGLLLLSSFGCATNGAGNTGASDAQQRRIAVSKATMNDPYFQLMLGEMAGGHGEFGQALTAYRQAMKVSDDPRVAQRAVEVASFARVPTVAYEAAQRWVALAPKSTDAHLSAGLWALRLKQLDAAVGHFDAVLNTHEVGINKGFEMLSARLAREQLGESALALFKRLQEKHPKLPEAHYATGAIAMQAGDFALAQQQAEAALALQADYRPAHILSARALQRQGQTDAALARLKRILQAEPNDEGLRLIYGQMLVQAEKNSEAEAEFRRVLRRSPQQPDALFAMALLGLDAERYDDAKRYFQQTLETGHHLPASAYYLGAIAEERQQWAEAVRWYNEVREGERLIDAQLRIGRVLAANDQWDEMRLHYADMRERLPELAARFWLAEAEELFDGGFFEAAYSVFNQGVEAYPDDFDLRYGRSLASERLGNLAEVEADLRYLLAQKPDDPIVLNALGYTLADRTARHEEALGYIQQALAIAPDKAFILDSMGWVLYKMGQPEKALDYLRKAYAQLRDPEVAAHLGEVLWVIGKKEQANNIWRQAQREFTGHRSNIIDETRQRLQR